MSAVTFTAAVCTKGRPTVVAGALAALAECDPAPLEVLVVDGDEDAESARPAAAWAGARYVVHEPGLTKQRNRALDEARGEVVAFFDDDARPAPDVFARLADAYADPSVLGATGPVIEPGDHARGGKASPVRRLVTGRGRPGTFTRGGYPRRYTTLPDDCDVEFMQGAFLTVRRDVGRELRFDEHLPGYGLAEDEDFSRRLSQRGRIRYVADAVVHHENLGFGTRDARAFNRSLVVNRLHLFRKNFASGPAAWAGFVWMLVVLFGHRLVNRDWRGLVGLAEGVLAVLGTGSRPPAEKTCPNAEAGGRGVLFVSSHGQDGGSERYLERLAARVAHGGVVVLEDGPLARRLPGAVVLPTGPGVADVLRSAWRLRGLARGAALVHANGVKAAVVSVAAGLPTVWVKHDHSFDGVVGRVVARRCRAVVGVSESVLRGVGGRGVVVPTGIDVPDVDVAAARALVDSVTGGRRPVITLVGRLDPLKGHEDLLAAAPPDATVLFVGPDDPHHADYAAALRARGGALVLGERDDVLELLAGSDVVAMPSRNEGFGLVAAEAMSVGTPVVAYGVGALPEVVGDCGVMVPPGDVAALRAALGSVLASPPNRGCGPARVRERFSTERWVAEMQAVYARAARASGRRASRR